MESGFLLTWSFCSARGLPATLFHGQISKKLLPLSMKLLQKPLMDPFGKIIFSAEYANKFHNGWVESALESAIRNLVNLWPDQYLKDFGKQEAAFFKEEEKLFNSNSTHAK